MSAPKHAKPLGKEGWLNADETPCDINDLPTVTCDCGWHGSVTELLGVDPEENETLWCPKCGSMFWEYD